MTTLALPAVPAGSPSRGGGVTVYVWNKPTELAYSFFFFSLFLCLFKSLWPFPLYFIP